MSEAIETLQHYLSDEINIIHYYGNDTGVEHFLKILFQGVIHDYEAPDMYIEYQDEVWIIEHFEIDSFRNNRKGSSFRTEQRRIERKKDLLIPTEDGVLFHDKINAISSYDDYINNVKDSFESHYRKIEKYKLNLMKNENIETSIKFHVMFLIDDVSPLGTSCDDDKNGWMPIDLAHSKEFLDIMSCSKNLDCVLATSCGLCDKFIWFIERNQLEEYYKETIDYRTERFLDFKPNVFGFKMSIPSNKIDKEVNDNKL